MRVADPDDSAAGALPATVPWEGVRQFQFEGEGGLAPLLRTGRDSGPPAMRVRQGWVRSWPPCAFAWAPPPTAAGGRSLLAGLYADAACSRPICTVDLPVGTGGEQRWTVRDAYGREIGAVRRVPGSLLPRSWRIEQPGRPEITGRSDWVTWNLAWVSWKLLVAPLVAVFKVFAFLLEGDDVDSQPRRLVWRAGAGSGKVAVSRGSWRFDVRAGWLDPRLLFAFAVIGDRDRI